MQKERKNIEQLARYLIKDFALYADIEKNNAHTKQKDTNDS